MLKFRVDHGETEITVTGQHTNPADTPPLLEFTRTHALGTSRSDIEADLDTYLDGESRTDYVVIAHAALKLKALQATNGTDHRQVNYKTGLTVRLFQNLTTVYRGEVRKVEYFNDEAKTDLVLTVDVAYNRALSGLATDRTTTRTWKRTDDTDHPDTKVTKKLYDNFHAAKEGRTRRENVVGKLKIDTLEMIIVTTAVNPMAPTQAEVDAAQAIGVPYILKYQSDISLFIETGDLAFKVAPASPNITDDSEAFLDTDFTGSATIIAIAAAKGWTGDIRSMLLGALKGILEA